MGKGGGKAGSGGTEKEKGARAGLAPPEPAERGKPIPGWGEAEAYADKCVQHPDYAPEVVKEATARGTALVRAAGSWKDAVGLLREVWTGRFGNNLDGLLSSEPEGLIDAELLALTSARRSGKG